MKTQTDSLYHSHNTHEYVPFTATPPPFKRSNPPFSYSHTINKRTVHALQVSTVHPLPTRSMTTTVQTTTNTLIMDRCCTSAATVSVPSIVVDKGHRRVSSLEVANGASAATITKTSENTDKQTQKPPSPTSGNSLAPPTKRMARPPLKRVHSSPSDVVRSPSRHHMRLISTTPKLIKETLDASYHEDETGKTLNNYLIQEEIGAGAFGTVYRVVDTTTQEKFAMKSYSKARLRKMNQTEWMQLRRKLMRTKDPVEQNKIKEALESFTSNPLNLIRREIAILKKLDHPNIVNLVEVLDDPHGDSLYMVMDWCHGVLMHSEETDGSKNPKYTEEQCRLYFRDMILGIEFLHSQGVIHRDIKADNMLLSEDDILKIADFGVSEMFESENDTVLRKAGSPSYMAPELALITSPHCLERASQVGVTLGSAVSGRAADIWSMGVTLYFMLYGKLPFASESISDLCEQIIFNEAPLPEGTSEELVDLFQGLLAKNPAERMTMAELREHEWVNTFGDDPLVEKEENIGDGIPAVTKQDLAEAFERIAADSANEGVDHSSAFSKLKRIYGWRGTGEDDDVLSSFSTSTADTPSEPNVTVPQSMASSLESSLKKTRNLPSSMKTTTDEKFALHKLNMALDEIVQEQRKRDVKKIEGPPPQLKIKDQEEPKIASMSSHITAEPESDTSEKLERRPSRTRVRKILGLEAMTAVRSRSLDTDDRIC